uniref:Uncharacterized protein n=1 Tax=Syphacia muris TaxID=451379 RepID=A0A0N5AW39_9BILA
MNLYEKHCCIDDNLSSTCASAVNDYGGLQQSTTPSSPDVCVSSKSGGEKGSTDDDAYSSTASIKTSPKILENRLEYTAQLPQLTVPHFNGDLYGAVNNSVISSAHLWRIVSVKPTLPDDIDYDSFIQCQKQDSAKCMA